MADSQPDAPIVAEVAGVAERGLLPALVAFQWAAWVWMVVLGWWERGALDNAPLAGALAAAALAVTTTNTLLLRRDPTMLTSASVVTIEMVVAVLIGLGNGLAYDGTQTQAFGSVWPLTAVLAAGIAGGWRTGLLAGAVVGLGDLLGQVLGAVFADGAMDDAPPSVAVVSSGVLYALAGGMAGLVTEQLDRAEAAISAARAREEVARTLHDGVLQTLAVVQRRSTDPDLARLAREQEQELRAYLFGNAHPHDHLGAALLARAARFEHMHGGRAEVVLVDDPVNLPRPVVAALSGAVSEALTNASKHGAATHATVYVEALEEGGVFVSVKDDGCGFDATAVAEGTGISRSIRARIAEVDGRVEIDGRPGRGTEVRMWVP